MYNNTNFITKLYLPIVTLTDNLWGIFSFFAVIIVLKSYLAWMNKLEHEYTVSTDSIMILIYKIYKQIKMYHNIELYIFDSFWEDRKLKTDLNSLIGLL